MLLCCVVLPFCCAVLCCAVEVEVEAEGKEFKVFDPLLGAWCLSSLSSQGGMHVLLSRVVLRSIPELPNMHTPHYALQQYSNGGGR